MTLHRVQRLPLTDRLAGVRVLITGCGYRPVQAVFSDVVSGEPSHDLLVVDGQEMKLNIGAATAAILARHGAAVHMVATSEEKLTLLQDGLESLVGQGSFAHSAVDLLVEDAVTDFVQRLPSDLPLYWVQSVGVGAGSYQLSSGNPYLPLEQISLDMLERETRVVLRATHLLMQHLLPLFRRQVETRVALLSSMSAIRGYSLGCSHCAAKAALSRYTNAAMLYLYPSHIYLTDVRPGAVDTGMYDAVDVQRAAAHVATEYGCDWSSQLRLAPPTSVGEAIAYVFTTPAHIPSLNLVARGQFPHEGS